MNSGIDEVMFLNENEFKETLDKWKKSNTEMSDLLNEAGYQSELITYKSTLTYRKLLSRFFTCFSNGSEKVF